MGTSATLNSRITTSMNPREMLRVNTADSIEESNRKEEKPIEKFCYTCGRIVKENRILFFWEIRCGECKKLDTGFPVLNVLNAKRLREDVQESERGHQKASSNVSVMRSLEMESSWRGAIRRCLKKVSDTKVSPTSTLSEKDDLSIVSKGPGDTRIATPAELISTCISHHDSSPSVSALDILRDCKPDTSKPNITKTFPTPNSHLLERKENSKSGIAPQCSKRFKNIETQDLNAPGCVIRNRTSPDKNYVSTVSRGETGTPYRFLETEEFVANGSGCEYTKMATFSAQLNSYRSPSDSPPSVSTFNISRDFKKSPGNENTNISKSNHSNTLSIPKSHTLESQEKSREVESSPNQTLKRSKAIKRTAIQDSKAPECVIRNFLRTPKDGHYIVVQQAIEECPLCYTELYPSMFTLNIEYFILTTVCTGCELTIYIIFQPPDGSPPKIFTMEGKKPGRPKKKKKKYFPPKKGNQVIIVYDDDLALISSGMLWGM